MTSYNSVTLLGNLGGDPELHYTQSGKSVANLRLAVNERYTNAQGNVSQRAHWFRVTCWEKLAEVANEYLAKGSRVLVSGRLTSRSYEAADGSKRYAVDVVAQNLVFLDSVKAQDSEPTDPPEAEESQDELAF